MSSTSGPSPLAVALHTTPANDTRQLEHAASCHARRPVATGERAERTRLVSTAPQPSPTSHPDRRRSPRIENLGRLHAEVLTADVPVTIYDFSTGGLSLLSQAPLIPGKVHRLRIGARGGPSVELSARVAHCRRFSRHRHGDEYHSGLAFKDLDETGRRAIDGLIDVLTSTLSFE